MLMNSSFAGLRWSVSRWSTIMYVVKTASGSTVRVVSHEGMRRHPTLNLE